MTELLRHYAIIFNTKADAGATRSDYHAYRERAREIVDRLKNLLEQRGLADQVTRWGDATAFDVYFVDATEAAAEVLRASPDVEMIDEIDDVKSSLSGKKHSKRSGISRK